MDVPEDKVSAGAIHERHSLLNLMFTEVIDNVDFLSQMFVSKIDNDVTWIIF